MFQVFGWLRAQVKAAVLSGIADAMSELDAGDDVSQAATLLRQRLQALPAPSDNGEPEPVGRRRKKDD